MFPFEWYLSQVSLPFISSSGGDQITVALWQGVETWHLVMKNRQRVRIYVLKDFRFFSQNKLSLCKQNERKSFNNLKCMCEKQWAYAFLHEIVEPRQCHWEKSILFLAKQISLLWPDFLFIYLFFWVREDYFLVPQRKPCETQNTWRQFRLWT